MTCIKFRSQKFRGQSKIAEKFRGQSKIGEKFRGQSKIAEDIGNSRVGGDFTLTPPICTSYRVFTLVPQFLECSRNC